MDDACGAARFQWPACVTGSPHRRRERLAAVEAAWLLALIARFALVDGDYVRALAELHARDSPACC